MCRIERSEERERRRRWAVMGLKTLGESRVEKLKSSMVSRPRMKLWMIRATTSVLLWTCLVQLTALGETWGPRVLKGWPSCFSQESVALDVRISNSAPKQKQQLGQRMQLRYKVVIAFYIHGCENEAL
ncbi:hypothetical protein U1Q18_005146 [Sarracenia purpurea var. burkii]